jgi:hypothetical protein
MGVLLYKMHCDFLGHFWGKENGQQATNLYKLQFLFSITQFNILVLLIIIASICFCIKHCHVTFCVEIAQESYTSKQMFVYDTCMKIKERKR